MTIQLVRTEVPCLIRRANGVIVELRAETEPPGPNAHIKFIEWPGDPKVAGVQITWTMEYETERILE